MVGEGQPTNNLRMRNDRYIDFFCAKLSLTMRKEGNLRLRAVRRGDTALEVLDYIGEHVTAANAIRVGVGIRLFLLDVIPPT
jgi:hypothetical protein